MQVVCYEMYQQFINLQASLQLSPQKSLESGLPIEAAGEKIPADFDQAQESSKKLHGKFAWSEEIFGIAWDLPKASHEQVQRLIQHLEQTLIAIGFFDPDNPKMIMQRLKRLLLRIQLDNMEVNLLRGILKTVQGSVPEKVMAKREEEKEEENIKPIGDQE